VGIGQVGDRFLDWIRGDPSDVGIHTRAVLAGAKHGGESSDRAARYFEASPRASAGNGSLMRTAPVALAHLGDDGAIVRAAMKISGMTHADPLGGEAYVNWCVAIDRAYGRAVWMEYATESPCCPTIGGKFWSERETRPRPWRPIAMW
jgi:ADP-ribosylglycohydrolase